MKKIFFGLFLTSGFLQGSVDDIARLEARVARNPDDYISLFNVGVAAFKEGNLEKAGASFSCLKPVALRGDLGDEKAKQLFYNAGNTEMKRHLYKDAYESFDAVLRYDPANEKARQKRDLARKLLEKQQQQEKQKDEKKKEQENQEQKQQEKDHSEKQQDKQQKESGDRGKQDQKQGGSKSQQGQNKQDDKSKELPDKQDAVNRDHSGEPQDGGQQKQGQEKENEKGDSPSAKRRVNSALPKEEQEPPRRVAIKSLEEDERLSEKDRRLLAGVGALDREGQKQMTQFKVSQMRGAHGAFNW